MRSNPRLLQGTKPKLNRFIKRKPFATQSAFLFLNPREGLFGGQAGGGKSELLLMGALQYVEDPEYHALILRREFTDFRKSGNIMDRSHQWLRGTGATWNGSDHRWTFPSGATLEFGSIKSETDKYAYQSAAYAFIGFEELTQFTRSQYTYLFSRNRKPTGAKFPLRVWSASNPGGVGHSWVFDRFFVEGKKEGRTYMPSRLEDNPFVDRASYEEQLRELDPVEYAQLRKGDWKIKPSGKVYKKDMFKIADVLPAELGMPGRGWDTAATSEEEAEEDRSDPDYSASVAMVIGRNGLVFITDFWMDRIGPDQVEGTIKVSHDTESKSVHYEFEQEPGSSGKMVAKRLIKLCAGRPVEAQPSTGDKLVKSRPFAAQARAGNVRLIRGPWNSAFIDHMVSFGSGATHDDGADACHIIYNRLSTQDDDFNVHVL